MDSLNVKWNMTDDESGISHHYLSVMAALSSTNDIPTIKVK